MGASTFSPRVAFVAASLVLSAAAWPSAAAHADPQPAVRQVIDNSVHRDDKVAGNLNRAQLVTLRKGPSLAPAHKATPADKAAPADKPNAVQIVVLRSDGGDPRRVRVDDPDNVIYALSRSGEEHVFKNGREVEILPAIKEAAKQIATARLSRTDPADAGVFAKLPAAAKEVVKSFRGGAAGGPPVEAHLVSRDDTARLSEVHARKILAMDTQTRGKQTDQAGMVELVKTVMRMYGLKSDVCDDSTDERCSRPGVREAFAEIKRQEAAAQRTASPAKRG